MKKHLFKSFALIAMLFSAMSMSAATYCSESMKSNVGWDGNYQLSAEKVSETQSRLTITALGEEVITGFYQFIIQNLGGGAATTTLFDPGAAEFSNPELFDVAADGKSAIININWTTYPTGNVGVHMILRRNNSSGGSDIFGNTITDLDLSATCSSTSEGGEDTDTETPVLESVELFGAAQTFVWLTPTVTDDKGVTSYIIAKSGGTETEVTPDATTGQIKISPLTIGTTYTYSVKAKDEDGNVSNAKEITFSTLDNVFCEEEVLPNTTQEYANQKITFTAKKVSDTETYLAISSSTSTLTKISTVTFYNNTGETGTYGGGVLPEGYVLKDGWTLTDNTLSKTVTWTTYPTAPFRASINASREKNTDEKALINVLYTMDLSNTCGEEPTPEPTPDPTVTPGYSAGAGTNAGANYTYVYTNDDAGNVRLWVTFSEALVGVAGPQFYTDGNVAIEATTTDNKVFYTSVTGKKDGDVVKLRARIPRAGGLTQTPLLSHTVGTESGLIVTEYCNYTNAQLTKNGIAVTLTWETVDNGDVVITIGNGVGATSCAYRNGGFEGGIDAFVVSEDNFATTTPASDYFTFEKVYSGNEARLVKVADLPKGTKIKHIGAGHALAWTVNGNGEYDFPDFIYTYGGMCNNLDAPTNVAVTDAGVITFDPVDGADTYEVRVYQGATLKHTQDIVSGGTINFVAYADGAYTVKVVAKGAGKGDSEESDGATWNMTAAPLPGSNYCEMPADRITANNGSCSPLFTWVTTAAGNVTITLTASEGDADATKFRNNGMNGEFRLDGSADSFNAYFDRGKTDDYTYTLTLKDAANQPALGAAISYSGQIEAASSINGNDWSNYEFDGYLYGTKCATLSAPTNVAITAAGILTFDAVDGAESYIVHVYDGEELKLEQTIASGDKLEYYTFVAKTFQVCVVAKAGSAKSEESEKVTWTLASAYLNASSEYCEQIVTSGHYSVIFDWQTNDAGSVIITISEADGGAAGTTHFRANAMSNAALDKFKVGESREAANLYFERVYTENEQVYELRLKAGKQLAPGTKIYHTGYVEFVSESEGGNAYHDYGFEYTYGTRCVGYQVSATSADPAMGSAVVKQNGVEVTTVEGGTVQFVATPVEGCVFVNWTQGGVEVSTSATYETEITATTRLVANFDYVRTIYCQQAVQTNAGKTVYLTVGQAATAGKYQIKIEGTADLTITGLYNANTMANNIKFTAADATAYDGNDVPLTIANGGWTFSNEGYGVITSAEFEPSTGKTWKDMWFWQPALVFSTNTTPDIQEINAVLIQRNHFDWSYKCEDDTEKPVMGTASLVSASYSDALIAVSATDNRKVEKYHIVETAHAIDVTMMPTDGKVMVSGLTANTTYTFVITAIDFAGNESANNASVSCTTQAYVLEPTSLPAVPTLPENQVRAVYSDTYNANCNFGEWGSATQYTPDTYGKKFVTTELGYFGLIDLALNCSKMEALHLDVWSAESFTLRVVPIHGGAEVGVTKTIMGGQWNAIDIALSEFAGVENWSNVYQIKIDNAFNQTFWLNNIYFYTTQVSSDVTPPTNLTATAVPSFTTAVIECSATDESGSVNFKVMYGAEQKAVGSADSGATARLTVTNLQPNREFTMTVIVTDVYGNEAAETVDVTFTTLSYPAPAPTPQYPAANVFSIYSNAYTPAVNRTFGWWGASTVEAEVELATGDNALQYTTCNYLGWELNATCNVSDYPYLHMDIYVENAGSIEFTPIWGAEALKSYTLKAGWNSIDIDLVAEFTGINLAIINQLKWAAMPATCFIDNVYFYKPIVVAEDTDPATLPNGFVCDVLFAREMTVKDGIWNTIALPFSMTKQQINETFGSATRVAKLQTTSTVASQNEIKLIFDYVNEIEAGVPYIILPEETGKDVVIRGVTLNTTTSPVVVPGQVTMHPVLKTITYVYTNGSDVRFFLAADGKLHYKEDNDEIRALRAYFTFDNVTSIEAAANVRARIAFKENETTGFDQIVAPKGETIKAIVNGQLVIIRGGEMYNVQGQKL